jgi:hypothetical protein
MTYGRELTNYTKVSGTLNAKLDLLNNNMNFIMKTRRESNLTNILFSTLFKLNYSEQFFPNQSSAIFLFKRT